MQPIELQKQIRIEQLRYLYNDEIAKIVTEINYCEEHIPPEYIFNNKRRRLKNTPHSQDFLYCRPFYVIVNEITYYSHISDGKFKREAIRCLPETDQMLLEITKMIISKSKTTFLDHNDLFGDIYCALLQNFRRVDINRTPEQVFSYIMAIGFNACKHQQGKNRNWNFYNHELKEEE